MKRLYELAWLWSVLVVWQWFMGTCSLEWSSCHSRLWGKSCLLLHSPVHANSELNVMELSAYAYECSLHNPSAFHWHLRGLWWAGPSKEGRGNHLLRPSWPPLRWLGQVLLGGRSYPCINGPFYRSECRHIVNCSKSRWSNAENFWFNQWDSDMGLNPTESSDPEGKFAYWLACPNLPQEYWQQLASWSRYIWGLAIHYRYLRNHFQGVKGVPPIQDGINPATWMLEVSTPGAEQRTGADFAAYYKSSAFAK